MTKYIDANHIYATWMVRNNTLAISNNTLSYLHSDFLNLLKSKGDFHILNLGEYNKDYFVKNSLGLICNNSTNFCSLMNYIGWIDMETYIQISNAIEESDYVDKTIIFKL